MSFRRKPMPALVMIAVLALVAGVVWVKVLEKEATVTDRVRCPAATIPAGDAVGTPMPYDALDKVSPDPPTHMSVRVLNTTDRTGLARSVANDLTALGVEKAGPPSNDEFFRTGSMYCVGQIRFGRAGRPAARTLSLLAPCTQLVQDDRRDSTVDLVLGVAFTALSEDYRVHAVLRQLADWASRHPDSDGGLQSSGGEVAPISPSTLADARPADC